ncbi:MAG TPA: DUF6491 family protein [Rhizomicrobium sp.]|nr:DUF6491 family protein [Rhizomicrobium sp.]
MNRKIACAALALTVLSGPAFAGAACLRQSQIYNWNALDDRTVIVENDFHQKFKLSLMVPCLNMQFHERLGFKVFGGTGLSCVSKGDSVISGSSIGPQSCPISKIEVYTPEMEKADKDAKAAAKAEH